MIDTSPRGLDERERIFPGDSELAALMRRFDWSTTPLGRPESWPDNLRVAVGICLTSRFPLFIWWGPSLTMLYNDAYISFLGKAKHPSMLGRSGREAWSEIWTTVGPLCDEVFKTGRPTWSEDLLMFFDRRLPKEEVYITFSYGPIFGDGAVEGIFCACWETTERLVGTRRLDTLRKLGVEIAEARTAAQACAAAAAVLAENPNDVPFAAIYVVDEGGTTAALTALTSLPEGPAAPPPRAAVGDLDSDSPWPLAFVLKTRQPIEIVDAIALPGGPWPEPARRAIVLPIRATTHGKLAGLLIAAVSARQVFDDAYRTFLDLVAAHIGAALADASAFEAERRRAEALAEVDRAKTVFFSNVSHEFRTPLTLMLGPLEEALGVETIAAPHRESLAIAHRSALRLVKLVNSLLDFARIEAGRAEAVFEPTDLAAVTRDVASAFHSVIERGGLRFVVDCPSLPEPVYVDRDMWEKIVLNLLSNAFNFTFEGEIAVELRPSPGAVTLTVRDTGTGIPREELPRMFERFHRVVGTRSRSQEGSGIGLALVHELVKLHRGRIAIASEVDRGTTVTTWRGPLSPRRSAPPRTSPKPPPGCPMTRRCWRRPVRLRNDRWPESFSLTTTSTCAITCAGCSATATRWTPSATAKRRWQCHRAMANVSGQPRVVRLHCEPYERNGTAGVLVEVEDAGMGFGGTDPAQLYDALYTTKPDGLGMGLSIARSIVEGYGGRLWATANPGHGVTFHFTTPIRPRP